MDQGISGTAGSVNESATKGADPNAAQLQEVVVTAQKRNERLQDVPVPVSVIDTAKLLQSNQLRLQDYYSSTPALNLTPGTQGGQLLTIRGIGTSTNPTVGITIDDIPFGNSTVLGGGQVVPDIDPGDLARLEILRGPQGTLYGASSMGGLLKYVTIDPSTDAFSARVLSGVSDVRNGSAPGYNVRGALNAPVTDTLAARISAFTHEDPGYIDDAALGLKGVNKTTTYGGLFSALYRPSELLSVKLTALLQDMRANGSGDVELTLGDLQQSGIPGVGSFDRKVQAYSAIVTARVGSMSLTSLTGFSTNALRDSFDYTSVLGGPAQDMFGVDGAAIGDDLKSRKFSQEVRLSAPIGSHVDLLLGVFYTHESSHWSEVASALSESTGAAAGQLLLNLSRTTTAEYAAFADVTVHLTEQFDVQVGGRESRIRDGFSTTIRGLIMQEQPEVTAAANAFTYLFTPRFKVTPDLMVYARLASGYRAGGPNPNCSLNSVPCQYDPDKTQNYELGSKADFFDHRVSLDASLYYIDWKDIQLSVPGQFAGAYYINGSEAKSQGLELSWEVRPIAGLTVSAWTVWNQAVITKASPPGVEQPLSPGDRLPFSSRFSANLSVEQRFPLGPVSGYVGGAAAFIGNRASAIGASGNQIYPSYTKVDLRAGVEWGTWNTDLFATNVTDRRGILSGGTGTALPEALYYIQPRLIGASITKRF